MLAPILSLLARREAGGGDIRAYTTSVLLWSLENLLSASVDSDIHEGLARRGWYFHVSLLALPTLWNVTPNHPPFLLTAGSSLPVLTTSGVSFEDTVPIGGRYGYVSIRSYFGVLV
jgi:hypothetical protein